MTFVAFMRNSKCVNLLLLLSVRRLDELYRTSVIIIYSVTRIRRGKKIAFNEVKDNKIYYVFFYETWYYFYERDEYDFKDAVCPFLKAVKLHCEKIVNWII